MRIFRLNTFEMLDDYLELNRIGTINSRILFTDMPRYYDFDYKLKKCIAKETIEIYCIENSIHTSMTKKIAAYSCYSNAPRG
jgi:hypothetical protein